MPSDMVSLVVSTGLGVSVLAGILSGVCYVLAHGIKRTRNRNKSAPEWYCDICGKYLRSIDGILEGDKVVTCIKCQSRICKKKCANPYSENGWICQTCSKPSESWFQGILNAIQPTSKVFFGTSTKMESESVPQWDENLQAIRKKEKEQVRDFIERLVTAMLGENIDDASVTKVYNDKHYLPVTGQSPCTAHTALKQLIQRLLQEAAHLPNLQKAEDPPALPSDDSSNRTYEDLLATAILNKVVTSCQNNLPSSSRNSSRLSTSSRNHRDDKEYFFGEETLDTKWKTTDLDTSSISSLDELVHSDSSLGTKKYVDRRTLTIKHDIEEVFPTDSENEDDTEYFRTSSSLIDDDDANWFLQKRQFQGTHSPVPVPMLVPNPTIEAKVLIGDKEVDDTSDLSDAASDYGDMEPSLDVKSLLVESKTIIGGKNVLVNDAVSEDEASVDSGVKVKEEDVEVVQKTDITVDDDNVEDASILSVYSNTEKDTEYTERYASLPRTIVKDTLEESSCTNQFPTSKEVKKQNDYSSDEDTLEFRAGSYSKKEKEKWKHAIEMQNNPYSKENIEKRIQRSRSSTGSLFGSDYYARQASRPSGAKTNSSEVNGVTWPIERSESPEPDPEPEYEYLQAKPVMVLDSNEYQGASFIVTEEGDEQTFEQAEIIPEITSQERPESEDVPDFNTSELTSDSDLSYVNFYDVENAQIIRKSAPTEKYQIIVPEAKAFLEEETELKKFIEEKLDENANISSETDKHKELVVEPEISVVELMPKAKPRTFTKNQIVAQNSVTPVLRQMSMPATLNVMKRSHSDGELNESSFDMPPVILNKKRDNTLISKIYLDPRVRNVALTNRDFIPVEVVDTTPKPTYQKQFSVDVSLLKMSMPPKQKNQPSFSSDDEMLKSENSISETLAKVSDNEKAYFSSNEDLLSIDNNSEDTLKQEMVEAPVRKEKIKTDDPIITELCERRLVSSIKDQFSQSYPDLTANPASNNDRKVADIEPINEPGIGRLSVKDLMKKFENNNATVKEQPIYSLTARSISKQMREKLRN